MDKQGLYPMKLSIAPIIMVERPPARDGTLAVLQLSNQSRGCVCVLDLDGGFLDDRGVSGRRFK
jgi:hypothetical protein